MASSIVSSATRWLGGISHINSSLKETYHYHVVEIRAKNLTFYGTGVTIEAAQTQAELKKKMALGDPTGLYASFLAGKAPSPGEVYSDPLPSKYHVSKPLCFLSERRLAVMSGQSVATKAWMDASEDRKINVVRNFFKSLPLERLHAAAADLAVLEDYWDITELSKPAQAVLREILHGCDPPISHTKEVEIPSGSEQAVIKSCLCFMGLQFGDTTANFEKADELFVTALMWIRKQILDVLIASLDVESIQPMEVDKRVSAQVVSAVMAKYLALKDIANRSLKNISSFSFSDKFAAIVLQENTSFRVVALAAGHGTILWEKNEISRDSAGFLIKDCHAEMLVMRALKLFLYDQLETFFGDPKKRGTSVLGYGLNGYALHLFTSEKSCGHPRLMGQSVYESPFWLFEKTDHTENGLNSLTHEKKTEPAVRIMSCCDKLQKRCFLGVQGSLLSHLIIPVYLGVVFVGSKELYGEVSESSGDFLLHPRLEEAFASAVASEQEPFGYGVVSPQIVRVKKAWTDDGAMGQGFPKAMCWYTDRCSGKTLFEFLDPETGRQLDKSFSLLCKRSLFLRFRSIYDNIAVDKLPPTATLNPHFRGNYLDYKKAAVDYGAQKQIFMRAVARAVETTSNTVNVDWITKPALAEKFNCTLETLPKGTFLD